MHFLATYPLSAQNVSTLTIGHGNSRLIVRQNWTFTLSLILHGLIAWWLIHAPDVPIPEAPIEIDVRDNTKTEKSVVMDPSLGEVLKQVKDQAKKWSKENRRVQKEMSALGMQEPPAMQQGSPEQQQQMQQAQQKKRLENNQFSTQEPDDDQGIKTSRDEPKSKLNPLLQNSGALRSVVTGQSTRGEFIPGLAQGSFTALNTDQFTYYTFFARMNEQIRPRWINHLRDFAYSQNQMEMQKLAQYPRTTQVEFILDSSGRLLDVIVHLTSGFRGLDLAGTDAFKEAAPINNPPQGLVEADGKIHLHYNFTVQWRE